MNVEELTTFERSRFYHYFTIIPDYLDVIFYISGYRVSQDVLTVLLKRYSRAHVIHGQLRTLIAFDDFVSLSVRLRAYTGMV